MTDDEKKPPRDTTIGASEVAPAMGLSPHKTPYRWWAERTGRLDRAPPSTAMDLGTRLEPLLLRTVVEDHDVEVTTGDKVPALFPRATLRHTGWSVPHPKHKHLRASPDGVIAPSGMSQRFVERFGVDVAAREHVLVEGKTVALASDVPIAEIRARWGKPGTDAIPHGYLLQMTAAIECINADLVERGAGFMTRGILRVLGAGLPLVDFHIVVSPVLVALVVDETAEIVEQHLVKDLPPAARTIADLDLESDLQTRVFNGVKETAPATFEQQLLWEAFSAARDQQEHHEHVAKALRNQIEALIGEKYGWHDPENPKRKLLLQGLGEERETVKPAAVVDDARTWIANLRKAPTTTMTAADVANQLEAFIRANTSKQMGGGRALHRYPRRKKAGEIE